MPTSDTQPFDISWGDFETKGFSDDFDSDTFSLFSEVGRPSVDEEPSAPRPQKLKKPYPYASLASRHLQFGRRYHPDQSDNSDIPALSEIRDIKIVKIDPVFIEVYLDSLDDPAITSNWPIYAVAELKEIDSSHRAVIVEVESTKRPKPAEVPSSSSTTSIPQSSSMKVNSKTKRGIFSLGSRKKRLSAWEPETQQGEGPIHTDKALFNEFGKRVAVESVPQAQSTASTRPSKAASTMPLAQNKRHSISTIVKTSPLTPPRRYQDVPAGKTVAKHATIAEETPEERSTPSPSESTHSSGRKLSRKPVPQVDNEADVVVDIVTEAQHPEAPALEITSAPLDELEMLSETSTAELKPKPVSNEPASHSSEAEITESQGSDVTQLPVPTVVVSNEDDHEGGAEDTDAGKERANPILPEHHGSITSEDRARTVYEPETAGATEAAGDDSQEYETAPSAATDSNVHLKLGTEEVDAPAIRDETLIVDEAPQSQAAADDTDLEPLAADISQDSHTQTTAKAQQDVEHVVPADSTTLVSQAAHEPSREDRASADSAVESTPKRFGSTLNRVSPSLKERFGSGAKAQSGPENDVIVEKAEKSRQPPSSPSRRAALLSGARKMLSRKKSGPSELTGPAPVPSSKQPPLPHQGMQLVSNDSSTSGPQLGSKDVSTTDSVSDEDYHSSSPMLAASLPVTEQAGAVPNAEAHIAGSEGISKASLETTLSPSSEQADTDEEPQTALSSPHVDVPPYGLASHVTAQPDGVTEPENYSAPPADAEDPSQSSTQHKLSNSSGTSQYSQGEDVNSAHESRNANIATENVLGSLGPGSSEHAMVGESTMSSQGEAGSGVEAVEGGHSGEKNGSGSTQFAD